MKNKLKLLIACAVVLMNSNSYAQIKKNDKGVLDGYEYTKGLPLVNKNHPYGCLFGEPAKIKYGSRMDVISLGYNRPVIYSHKYPVDTSYLNFDDTTTYRHALPTEKAFTFKDGNGNMVNILGDGSLSIKGDTCAVINHLIKFTIDITCTK